MKLAPSAYTATSAALLLTLTSCAAHTNAGRMATGNTAQLELAGGSFISPNDKITGLVRLQETDGKVALEVTVQGVAPGAHGFHLHQTGTCEGPTFTSAGGHLNPLGKLHGSLAQGGSHLGDLPNLDVDADGKATLSAQLSATQSDLTNWLFDADGTAVVIHETTDDYMTNPSGAAGSRIACAVLKQP
ncbi:MAG: superoxide dismutase family protein [Pontixanthobacter sp.]